MPILKNRGRSALGTVFVRFHVDFTCSVPHHGLATWDRRFAATRFIQPDIAQKNLEHL